MQHRRISTVNVQSQSTPFMAIACGLALVGLWSDTGLAQTTGQVAQPPESTSFSRGSNKNSITKTEKTTDSTDRSSQPGKVEIKLVAKTPTRAELYESLATDARDAQKTLGLLKRLVKVVQPTVVHIAAQKSQRGRSGAITNVEEAGAGVILEIENKFYVVTNRHVIVDAKPNRIRVQTFDGEFFYPTEIRTDRDTDLAVLFVDHPKLVAAKTANSTLVEMGDFVVAVGSPFGLNHSVSYGIVSALGRRDLELGKGGVKYQDFIQTDAAINPGNSGGPLMNIRGEVIGINTAIASNSGGNDGIGFTTPMNVVTRVASDLIRKGRVVRGFLGVSLDSNFTPEKAKSLGLNNVYGARITGVSADSPAAKADLKVGDIVIRYDGQRVTNDSDLVYKVSLTEIGQKTSMLIIRNGKRMTANVEVRDRIEFGLPPR